MMETTKISWQVASQTHCGNVREANEDSLLIHEQQMLWAVADGMGGYEAGDVASEMIVEQLAKISTPVNLEELIDQTRQAVSTANDQINQYSIDTLECRRMGSTVVCLLAENDQLSCLWAGDSRLYRSRSTGLEQISLDHSEVARLVQLGYLTEEEAIRHPKANVITRAVGTRPEITLEEKRIDAQPGDTFLLCSDGLYNEVSEDKIQQYLLMEDLNAASESLLDACLSTAAKDNVTIVVVRAVLG